MSVYLIPIGTALLLFPILAALITIPYMIIQYRTYGSILPFRVAIIYSFIFYLLTAYFLVLLPLPPVDEVAQYTSPIMQLVPFASLQEFTMTTSLVWNDPSTYLTALNEPSLFLILFNILLTVPFGIYLRYYFQCGWKKTLLFSLLLTLSFECLQLSALFGIYPRPYRLFDVDDLITNTLGGMLGYLITPLFSRFLLSRERMDEKAYDRGRTVSPLRRVFAFFCDSTILVVSTMIIILLLERTTPLQNQSFVIIPVSYGISLVVYLFLFPLWTKGKTLGKALVKIRLRSEKEETPRWYQYPHHFLFLYVLILPAPFYGFYLLLQFLAMKDTVRWILLGILILLALLYIWSITSSILALFNKDRRPWYDQWKPLHNSSDIPYEAVITKDVLESEAVQNDELQEESSDSIDTNL